MFTFFTIAFEKKIWRKLKILAMEQYRLIEDTIIDTEKIKNIVLSDYLNSYMRQILQDEDVTLITLIGKEKVDVFADRDIFNIIKREIENDMKIGVRVYRFPKIQKKPALMKPSTVKYIYASKSDDVSYEDIIDALRIIKKDIEILEISDFNTMVGINNSYSYERVIEIVVDFGEYDIAEYVDLFMSEKMFIKSCEECKLSKYGSAHMEVSSKPIEYKKDGEMFYSCVI